jgi:hypothetical protein
LLINIALYELGQRHQEGKPVYRED